MRFLADVNVSRRVVEGLRARGFSVVRVPEIMDPRSPDQAIIDEARRQDAIVISFDQDFGAILATRGLTTPSLINLRTKEAEAGVLADMIDRAIRLTESDVVAGAIVTLDDSGVRVHRLPLS